MWLMFAGTGASPLDMEATITTPSGVTELCEIRDEPDNLFDVKFTPIESGTNIISLKQKGIHIAGIVAVFLTLVHFLKIYAYLLWSSVFIIYTWTIALQRAISSFSSFLPMLYLHSLMHLYSRLKLTCSTNPFFYRLSSVSTAINQSIYQSWRAS